MEFTYKPMQFNYFYIWTLGFADFFYDKIVQTFDISKIHK